MSDDPNLAQTENEQDVPVVNVEELNQEPEVQEAAEQKVKDEEAADEDKVGGIGSVYKVPTSSYSAFKGAVNGRGYDIDNYYGWQCWDGAALLWQQFGLSLLTGNGLAIGAWDLKRTYNKGTRFDLVTNVNSLKLGDVVVMRPNHIGFFDGYDGGYMRILGQNQGGKPGPNGGMAFNIVKINKSAFAGAFRLKAWHATPKPPAKKSNDTIAKEVIAGKWGNGDTRIRRLKAAGYNPITIQNLVNSMLSKKPARKSNETIAREVVAGKWGNGSERKRRLIQAGYDYNAVQKIVNRLV